TLQGERLILKCKNCGNEEEFRGNRFEVDAFKHELGSKACAKCGKPMLGVETNVDIVDNFIDYAEKGGSRLEVISQETEEGRMLRDSFKKVAAVLRYAAN